MFRVVYAIHTSFVAYLLAENQRFGASYRDPGSLGQSQRKLDQFNQCVKEMGVTLIDGQKNVVMSSFTKCTGDLRAMLEDRGVGKVETILSKIDDIVRTRLEKVSPARFRRFDLIGL